MAERCVLCKNTSCEGGNPGFVGGRGGPGKGRVDCVTRDLKNQRFPRSQEEEKLWESSRPP